MDITEFLTARWDEEEAIARAASSGPWKVGTLYDRWPIVEDAVGYVAGAQLYDQYEHYAIELDVADAKHIALHDPARVLADLETKRAILDHHDRHGEDDTYLHLLARPYREHSDFDPAWSVP